MQKLGCNNYTPALHVKLPTVPTIGKLLVLVVLLVLKVVVLNFMLISFL